jgi:uncharacterized protein (TIGR03437 family)
LRTALAAASVAPAWGHILNLNPSAVTAGGPAFTLIVNGVDYDESDIVTWNGRQLDRCAAARVAPCFAYINGIRMEVAVPPGFIAVPGTAIVGLLGFNSETLFINPRPTITTASPLPNATAGATYSATLNATGGTLPLRWSIGAGALPAGLLLDATGRITGAASTPGAGAFTIAVADAMLASDTKVFSLTVADTLQITTASLPSGARGATYDFALQATGGARPLTWSLVGSTLPAGLTLSSAGVISGTPTAAGTANITVRVSDPDARSATKAFTLTISESAGGPFTSVHGAIFQGGAAPEAIVAGFGENLASSIVSATSTSLPSTLAGVTVNVRDNSGRESQAPLFFVSQRQINYVVPSGMASGPATVTVRNGVQAIATGSIALAPVQPGFFTANADGVGVAAANVIRVAPDLSQTYTFVFRCGSQPGSCEPEPFDVSSTNDSVYLLLFGTGIRGRTALAAVTATVGGVAAPVVYAGAQNEYPGLDQVNVGPLPRILAGRGEVPIRVVVDGTEAPAVTVAIR